VAGDTEADAIAAMRAKLMPVLSSLKPLADDDVLVELARLYAEQYHALGLKSATLCYLFVSGADTKLNYSAELPAALITRELELNERVIRTAARRTPATAATLESIRTKLSNLMSIQGVTADKLKLLQTDSVPPSGYADYCMASTGFFKAISNLPQRDSAALMRNIFADK
jgi:hypothetical protein